MSEDFDPGGLTSIVVGGVQCWDESAEEDFKRSGSTATRQLLCRWTDRMTLVAALVGMGIGGGVLQVITPAMQYPDASWLIADGAQPKGVGVPYVNPVSGMIAYKYARVTVVYKTLDYTVGGFGGGAFQIDFGSYVLSAPQDEPSYRWAEGTDLNKDLPVNASPNVSVATATIVIPQRNEPNIVTKMGSILDLVDHVNGDPFLGAAKGTMLYKGATSFGRKVGNGIDAYDFLHKVYWRKYPWNTYYNPRTGLWQKIKHKATGQPLFPDGNLDVLIQ